jgi:pimeloyl-ACP methyl ester carboxylesterase
MTREISAEINATKKRSTPPFRTSRGDILAGSIAEIGYQRLGGVNQCVMIRGESLSNPPLIILHGGPGFSDTPFFRRFNRTLERHFTIVYWDQRGVGKSFDPKISKSSMTVEQFIADLDQLVHIVLMRTAKSKVAIFGHSWGSVLGVLYSARFAQNVSAYIGCGQYGDWSAAESASYAFAVAEAERLNKRKALKELADIGPPPYSASSLLAERTWLQRFEGQLRPGALWNMARTILGEPESSIFDLPNVVRGFQFSLHAMWAEVSRLNLHELAPSLQIPVFFMLGRRDHWVPPETSVAYFDALTAPFKKLVWFEESGHEPFADEPDKFNTAMIELVRPIL